MVKDFSALPRKLNHSHSQSKPPSRLQGTRDFIILHKTNNGLVPACSLELNFAKRQTMAGLSLVGAMSPGPMPEEWPCWLFGIWVMVSFASPVISEPLERDHSWSFWILAAVVGILFSCSLWYGWIFYNFSLSFSFCEFLSPLSFPFSSSPLSGSLLPLFPME